MGVDKTKRPPGTFGDLLVCHVDNHGQESLLDRVKYYHVRLMAGSYACLGRLREKASPGLDEEA